MDLQPGDVGLARGSGLVDWAIRFGESRRYGGDSPEARWNHAFLIVSAGGDLIEAQGKGMVRATMAEYSDANGYTILRPTYPAGGADKAVAAMTGLLGEKYNFLEIASLAFAYLTQTSVRIGVKGEQICSGAVSFACDQGGVPMGEDEEWNSPADVMHVALQQGWAYVGGVPLPAAATPRKH